MEYTVEQLRLWDDDPDAFSLTWERESGGYFRLTVRTYVRGEGWLTQPPFDRLTRRELDDVTAALLELDLREVWRR